ncbi:porin [Parabacteroides sp. PF5-6]|uniref:porin n=1 Tax=Parabacteroides sp. PF5-6 TaxID=1742403 RepID=UPI0024072A76|nr:porin [Parabacteroides sp. PF5-6]MDF9829713.1 hypothetical protein [Parabacteroides sp. PF5-6]
MKTRQVILTISFLFGVFIAYAQDGLKNLTVSGYIQGQYQYGQQDASLKVGGANEDPDDSFSRIGIRRGRLKVVYEEGIASGVFQIDLTEKGIGFKDVYVNVKDPWLKTNALRAGIFDRPFGYEISYSSSRRESPERSTVFQTLFPEERDLGAMLILQPAQSSPFHFLKLEAGWFAGNGIKQETDNKRDFIGHLSATKRFTNGVAFGLGVSHYNGSVYQGTENVYRMSGDGFVLNTHTSHTGKFAKREYYGLDAQVSVNSILGKSQLRGEYLFGQQPGTAVGTQSPNSSALPVTDTYIRDFQGGYIFFVQDLGQTPFGAVLKYDWYDPNTKVSGDQVGRKDTTRADLAQSTWGVGGLWHITSALRLQAYYEFNQNEKTSALEGMNQDLDDNVFTLRIQYKF